MHEPIPSNAVAHKSESSASIEKSLTFGGLLIRFTKKIPFGKKRYGSKNSASTPDNPPRNHTKNHGVTLGVLPRLLGSVRGFREIRVPFFFAL